MLVVYCNQVWINAIVWFGELYMDYSVSPDFSQSRVVFRVCSEWLAGCTVSDQLSVNSKQSKLSEKAWSFGFD